MNNLSDRINYLHVISFHKCFVLFAKYSVIKLSKKNDLKYSNKAHEYLVHEYLGMYE